MSFEPIFYDPKDMDSMEVLLEGSGRELAPQWGIERGLISKIRLTSTVMEELNEKTIPADAQLEATVDRISRILLGQKIMLFIYGFLIFLSITSFLALYYKAWFYTYLNRSLYLISILPVLMSLQHPLRSIPQTPVIGTVSSVFLFVLTILLIYMIFMISKVYEDKADRFNVLQTIQDGEEREFQSASSSRISWVPMLFHFGGIMLAGILLGNLVYIPIFLLQKHYSFEFGILLIILLFFMMLFYIRNYFRMGKNNELTSTGNITLSVSYLQFRVIRNTIFIVFTVVGVTLFVVLLFTILSINTSILDFASSKGF
ncbi:putative membrane protein [Leptospira mayottensis 200901122]|uniref:Membrane protein n=2 Tax=Leptospira mayottensis TaxID=1137606 RepID=A0AA87SYZ8_9LEPT|nr:putative membrane protein [Leptospira mayottensis 200901122]